MQSSQCLIYYRRQPEVRGCSFKAHLPSSQQTQIICITFVQRRPNVFDVSPTLYKCYTNDLCLLGFLSVTHVSVTSGDSYSDFSLDVVLCLPLTPGVVFRLYAVNHGKVDNWRMKYCIAARMCIISHVLKLLGKKGGKSSRICIHLLTRFTDFIFSFFRNYSFHINLLYVL